LAVVEGEMRIVITGAGGLLGQKILQAASTRDMLLPTHYSVPSTPNSVKMDVTDIKQVHDRLLALRPDAMIHAAALTNVDECERDKERATLVNSLGTRNVAEVCRQLGCRMIYVSTDYVFNGEKGMYVETDTPSPINHYGSTKLEGEDHVKELCEDYAICRTSVLYGWNPTRSNFATWIIDSLRKRRLIKVMDDHYNSPTLADNLAEALLELAHRPLCGVFHTAGAERVSRYDFAVGLARTFNLEPDLIARARMKDLKFWVARRPPDSSLSVDKAERILKTRLMKLDESLKTMLETKPASL